MHEGLLSFLDRCNIDTNKPIGVGVSGGADSMCLAHILAQAGFEIHAFTVDHGLRAEAKTEAAQVSEWLKSYENVTHHILTWSHEGVEARIQEAARKARFDLMHGKCLDLGIETLFLGHHRDDQAETVLMRLSKGSGLDGLGGMEALSIRAGLKIARPLLDISHAEIVAFCTDNKIQWIEDPSNRDEKFERVRLRRAREVLEAEGLSNKRLALTAQRLIRAKQALEEISKKAWKGLCVHQSTRDIHLDFSKWQAQPEEIQIRVLQKAFLILEAERDYAPRLERIENLNAQLRDENVFKKVSFGHCFVERKNDKILIYKN